MSDILTLLPPSASQVERDLEQVIARLAAIAMPIRTLWNPDTCPAAQLPYLAWALSVEDWEPDWTDAQKRQVIREAVPVHRIKGTRASVERALSALGFRVDISEWFEHGGPSQTFRLEAYADRAIDAGVAIDAKLYATVTRMIENVKPAHAHFVLSIGERRDVAIGVATGSRDAYLDRREVTPATRVFAHAAPCAVRAGHRAQQVSRMTHIFEIPQEMNA